MVNLWIIRHLLYVLHWANWNSHFTKDFYPLKCRFCFHGLFNYWNQFIIILKSGVYNKMVNYFNDYNFNPDTGLPEPEKIEVLEVSPLNGGLFEAAFDAPKKYRVHAAIHWSHPIAGPVAIGAGRYLGLGFCGRLQ